MESYRSNSSCRVLPARPTRPAAAAAAAAAMAAIFSSHLLLGRFLLMIMTLAEWSVVVAHPRDVHAARVPCDLDIAVVPGTGIVPTHGNNLHVLC
jgi:hypothetical protein